MKKLKTYLAKPWFAYTFAACVAILFYVIIANLPAVGHAIKTALAFLAPVIIGIITAYLLNPVSSFFEKKLFKKVKSESGRHTGGVILTLILIILILVLILVALIPSLVQSVSKLVTNWDSYLSKLDGLFVKAEELLGKIGISITVSNLSSLVEESLGMLVDFVKNNTKTILNTAGSIGTGALNIGIGLVFGFCFLAAKKTLIGVILKIRYAFINKENADKNDKIWKSCHEIFLSYFGCTLLDAFIVGVATLIFMLVFRLPYAPLIALIVAITNIIPSVGPIIGGVLGAFFLVLDKPINALWFVIFACAIQLLDGLVIKPRLFKGSLGIPAVWTLVLIILGGKVAGMLGILLAIPFAAILVILYKEILVPKLNKRTERINLTSGESDI
ncbi:MAG: AI-2E family transporter [Eubacterium sp.]|nr:AI-2E family transporter [Eubacterium sp.]